jgi:hypothetical protein
MEGWVAVLLARICFSFVLGTLTGWFVKLQGWQNRLADSVYLAGVSRYVAVCIRCYRWRRRLHRDDLGDVHVWTRMGLDHAEDGFETSSRMASIDLVLEA